MVCQKMSQLKPKPLQVDKLQLIASRPSWAWRTWYPFHLSLCPIAVSLLAGGGRAGEMARWFKVIAALPEDLVVTPTTYLDRSSVPPVLRDIVLF